MVLPAYQRSSSNTKHVTKPYIEQNSRRDRAALATRFVVRIVINGRVYLAARGEVEIYGLLRKSSTH